MAAGQRAPQEHGDLAGDAGRHPSLPRQPWYELAKYQRARSVSVSLLSVIAEHSAAVFTVCIPGFILSAGYITWKNLYGSPTTARSTTPSPANRLTPRRPQAPLPLTKPKSLEAGMAEHQVRGEAKTVKVPVPSTVPARDERKTDTERMPAAAVDDEARDSLFSGLSDKSTAKKEDTTVLRQAERMEELGFHNQVARSETTISKAVPTEEKVAPTQEKVASPTSPETKTEVLAVPPALFRTPGQPPAAPAPVPSVVPAATAVKPEVRPSAGEATVTLAPTPANRTQTQELDDILSRIDKVLAENPVLATTTLGSASGEATVGPKPTPPRPEDNRVDSAKPAGEPPTGQQKLF